MNKIKAWVLFMCSKNCETTVAVGSRFKTCRGMGTVTGGSIHVKLDEPFIAKNGTRNVGFTHNISNIHEVRKNA